MSEVSNIVSRKRNKKKKVIIQPPVEESVDWEALNNKESHREEYI